MGSTEEQILRTAKEIVVKFIETGRVSPAGFAELFTSVYRTIDATVKASAPDSGALDPGTPVPADPAAKGRAKKPAGNK